MVAPGVTARSVTPGFMRTETVLATFGATEENWREVAETSAAARRYHFIGSETPCFVGRGIAALAADPEDASKSGGLFGSWDLADEYGFEDVDGRRPHWRRAFAEHLETHRFGEARTPYRWEIVRA